MTHVGAPVPRIEGTEKVTGRALYAADIALPSMLWGKVLRSPHPHARIVRIDAARAWQVPGVRAVVTGQDIPGHLMGKVMRDMPVLCWDRVRFIGDRVAAVAAETIEAADAALDAIHIEYEVLPAAVDALAATQADAPVLHPDVASYDGAPTARLATDVRNGQTRLAWEKGDVEQGFGRADLVLEHTFRVPSRHQGYLEPHASLVAVDEDGRIQVWTSTKAPFRARAQLAKAIRVPEERIRVNVVFVGGDFGGKGDALDAPIAYFLARQAGRPVKIVMDYTEDLTASNPSHATTITIRSGVSRDGRIIARSVKMLLACGAYAALEPNALISAWHWLGGAYRVNHSAFELLQIYTNTVPGGYFRAPGAHQYTFALECHTDILARALGIDPANFRLANLIGPGDVDALGMQVREIKAREVLQAALEAAGWEERKPGPGYGRGIGLYGQQIGGGPGGAILTAERNGSLSVLIPTFDQGAGTSTIMQQLVADEMGLPLDRVQVVVGDTDTAPYDDGARASRVTYTEGRAVLEACRQLRGRLAQNAATLLDCQEDHLSYADGVFAFEGRSLGLVEVVASAHHPITVTVQIEAPQPEDVVYSCAQVAEVEVDPETGRVHVHRLVTAHDVGTIINPVTHQGQIDGGVATGIGLALMEELVMEEGRITSSHLGEYKLPTAVDVPRLETVLVPSAGGTGPHGAKAIGEFANNPLPAAIANAVADAVGAHVMELPITAERVLRPLERRAP